MRSGSSKSASGIYAGSNTDYLFQGEAKWFYLADTKFLVDSEEYSEERLKSYGWKFKIGPRELVQWKE